VEVLAGVDGRWSALEVMAGVDGRWSSWGVLAGSLSTAGQHQLKR
jgi:hypothetical protein